MEPILDERSLIAIEEFDVPRRVLTLARALKALHQLGAAKVLRTLRDAPDVSIGEGRGLRTWCHDKRVDRDAGRYVATLLGKQPFIDGPDGLLLLAQKDFAFEAKHDDVAVMGLAVVALTGGVGVALEGFALVASGRSKSGFSTRRDCERALPKYPAPLPPRTSRA